MVGGRNAQPISIVKANGRKHLTKAEITVREKSEIKFGDNKLKCPTFIKTDVFAFAKWKEITKLYKDIDFVSSGDVGLLARYCMTFSEYQKLLEHRQRIDSLDGVNFEDMPVIEQRLGEETAAKLLNKINYILSVDGVLKIDTAINKKMDMLIKMEDRLFLNPLAKVKNVPKQEKKSDDPLAAKGFGNI